MSLNWNLKDLRFDWKCKGVALPMGGYRYPNENEESELFINPVTEALIRATMAVGILPKDEKSTLKFAQRVRMWETVSGPLVRQPKDMAPSLAANAVRPDSFTPEGYVSWAELKRHEGMVTNVSTLTDRQFATKLYEALLEEATLELKKEAKA